MLSSPVWVCTAGEAAAGDAVSPTCAMIEYARLKVKPNLICTYCPPQRPDSVADSADRVRRTLLESRIKDLGNGISFAYSFRHFAGMVLSDFLVQASDRHGSGELQNKERSRSPAARYLRGEC
jgi:hypothetical protein